MNILNIVDGKELNNNLKIKNNKLDLEIKEDLYIKLDSIKDFKINIKVKEDKRIFLISNIDNSKLEINIEINKNSNLIFNYYSKNKNAICNINIDLYENSKIEYYYSTIGTVTKNLTINHNDKNTTSIVRNHGISNNEKQEFNIIEKIYKNVSNSKLKQASKIINLGDNYSTIRPIMLISNDDTEATHSSIICPVNNDDMLYLMSRGISYNDSVKLLTYGFLVNNLELTEEEKKLLDTYI